MSRHDKCEYEEKKKFLSYLKLPLGYGRTRSHKRTDSRAESSGANTPDPMSPHMGEGIDNAGSPITSPPATPLSISNEDPGQLPSISVLRRRTLSQSRWAKDKDLSKDETRCNTPEHVEVAPYERRLFPLTDDTYEKMLKAMPEDHKCKTNTRAQDTDFPVVSSDIEDKVDDYHDSESTESAYGDEDPNDPEWMDLERNNSREHRYKR